MAVWIEVPVNTGGIVPIILTGGIVPIILGSIAARGIQAEVEVARIMATIQTVREDDHGRGHSRRGLREIFGAFWSVAPEHQGAAGRNLGLRVLHAA